MRTEFQGGQHLQNLILQQPHGNELLHAEHGRLRRRLNDLPLEVVVGARFNGCGKTRSHLHRLRPGPRPR